MSSTEKKTHAALQKAMKKMDLSSSLRSLITVKDMVQVNEAKITFKKENFIGDVTGEVASPLFFVSNMPWR
jgi:hypothetical protein